MRKGDYIMFTTTDAKQISYDRLTHDYKASYEGNVIGWYPSYHEAEVALDTFASELAQQTAIETADMAALAAEQAAGAAPLLVEPTQPTCEARWCELPATHIITTTSPFTYTCCFHYSEEFTGTLCPCRTSAAPSASALPDTPAPTLPHVSAAPGTSGDILAMYREAYGWTCVALDEQFVIDRIAA